MTDEQTSRQSAEPPAEPPRAAWRVLLLGWGGLAAGSALAIGLKAAFETVGPARSWLSEKQPLGWIPYFLSAVAALLAIICAVEGSSRLVRRGGSAVAAWIAGTALALAQIAVIAVLLNLVAGLLKRLGGASW